MAQPFSRGTLSRLGTRRNHAIVVCCIIALRGFSAGQAQTTRPERTGFRETSSYADVLRFLDSLQQLTENIRVGALGLSPEGRRIPYALVAAPMVSGEAEARRSGKLVVYVQANIHAGEVEGKEAAQMFLRDAAAGKLSSLLQRMVLLVVPIYNPDGNERWGPGERNRPGQNGPALVGQNTNGQGLNLNRDYVKMEAPETRGAAALLLAWDPDLFIDLHTTNGSYHGYVLTYAPGLNPNSTPASTFARDRFLPEVRVRMRQRHHQPTFSYGNFRNQDPDSLAQGWETYDARPRFGTNWMGLRGRLAVLSEGYSNADFQTRIMATYNFVWEVLGLAAEERDTIKSLVRAADRQRGDSVVVRSVLGPAIPQDVVAEITRDVGAGGSGYARRQRTGVYRTIRMPVFDRFIAARKEVRPAAYLIPARLKEIVELLRRHGIGVEQLTTASKVAAQAFTVDSIVVAPLFEGHRTVEAEGQWKNPAIDSTITAGWYRVSTDQPLGTLAAYLLEPASEDGVVTWNLLDRELQAGADYPILRVRSSLEVPAVAVP
jgi:hypothetical protein